MSKKQKIEKKILIGIIFGFATIFAVALIVVHRREDLRLVKATYCSDVCPGDKIVNAHPFDIYKGVGEKRCKHLGGTLNYSYGSSYEYLGCTPKGYITLDQATIEMWAEYEKSN